MSGLDLKAAREALDRMAEHLEMEGYEGFTLRSHVDGLHITTTLHELREAVLGDGDDEADGRLRALMDVQAERLRQVEVEQFDEANDDTYRDGELVLAAAAYAMLQTGPGQSAAFIAALWPWSSETFKPKSRRENLVRAAALLLAEIERIDRLAGM